MKQGKTIVFIVLALVIACAVGYGGATLGMVIQYGLTDCEYMCWQGALLGGLLGFGGVSLISLFLYRQINL